MVDPLKVMLIGDVLREFKTEPEVLEQVADIDRPSLRSIRKQHA